MLAGGRVVENCSTPVDCYIGNVRGNFVNTPRQISSGAAGDICLGVL